MRLPPAIGGDAGLHQRRPDRAGEVVAAGRQRDGEAAPPAEPQRGIGDQRPEGRAAAEQPDQRAMDDGELRHAGRLRREHIAGREREDAQQHRHQHAEAVGQLAHQDAARGEAERGQRVGQRRIGPRRAEFGLHGGQRHHDGPEPDAAERAERDGGGEPHPGIAAVHASLGAVHDRHASLPASPRRAGASQLRPGVSALPRADQPAAPSGAPAIGKCLARHSARRAAALRPSANVWRANSALRAQRRCGHRSA